MKITALLLIVSTAATTAAANGVIERSMQSTPAGATDLVPRDQGATIENISLGTSSPKISDKAQSFSDFFETSEVLSVYIFKDRNLGKTFTGRASPYPNHADPRE